MTLENIANALPKLSAKAKNELNRALHALTYNMYFESIPCTAIANLVEACGGNSESMNGIYCGAEGRANCQIASNLYLTMTWYKMPSGRFEIVAYAS